MIFHPSSLSHSHVDCQHGISLAAKPDRSPPAVLFSLPHLACLATTKVLCSKREYKNISLPGDNPGKNRTRKVCVCVCVSVACP